MENTKNKLYQKMSKVMQDVSYLKKDGHISFGTTQYKAITEEKVTSTVRASLIEHGLLIIPIDQKHHKDGALTTVDVTYKIIDVDSGQFEEVMSSGTGSDSQDKGVGKAMTYAYKYLLLRAFAIPTGEDTDKISSAELDAKEIARVHREILKLLNTDLFTETERKRYHPDNWGDMKEMENYRSAYNLLKSMSNQRQLTEA